MPRHEHDSTRRTDAPARARRRVRHPCTVHCPLRWVGPWVRARRNQSSPSLRDFWALVQKVSTTIYFLHRIRILKKNNFLSTIHSVHRTRISEKLLFLPSQTKDSFLATRTTSIDRLRASFHCQVCTNVYSLLRTTSRQGYI